MKAKKDPALKFVVKKGDVDQVRELISRIGTDVNYLENFVQTLWRTPMTQDHVAIVRLLLESGAVVNRKVVNQFLTPPCSQYCAEIFTHILDYHHDVQTLRIIFESILRFTDRPQAMKILNLLLDWGLPINEQLDSHHTPFHMCIANWKTDFVS